MEKIIKLFMVSFAVSLIIAVVLKIPLIKENTEKFALQIDEVIK